MGIFENKFDKNPLPYISFFEIDFDFIPLQILQLLINIYLLFFVI